MLYMLFTRTIRDEDERCCRCGVGHRVVPTGGGACMCMSVTFVDLFVYI